MTKNNFWAPSANYVSGHWLGKQSQHQTNKGGGLDKTRKC